MPVGSLVRGTGKNDIDGTAHIPSDRDIGFYPESNEEILKGFTCETA